MTLNSDAKFENLVVSKPVWGIGWTFIKAHKSLKMCTLKGSFSPKRKIQVENFRGICVMTLKGDIKLKGKLTRGLKNDIRNLVNFHVSSWKSDNLHFDGFFVESI